MDKAARQLERASAAGSVEDEARWLVGRMRQSELTEAHLRFAASLGHAPSLLALAPWVPPEDDEYHWCRAAAQAGLEHAVRAGWALVGMLSDRRKNDLVGSRPVHLLEMLEAWLQAPTEQHTQELKAESGETRREGVLHDAARCLALMPSLDPSPKQIGLKLIDAVICAEGVRFTREAALGAVRAATLPLLLGHDDPMQVWEARGAQAVATWKERVEETSPLAPDIVAVKALRWAAEVLTARAALRKQVNHVVALLESLPPPSKSRAPTLKGIEKLRSSLAGELSGGSEKKVAKLQDQLALSLALDKGLLLANASGVASEIYLPEVLGWCQMARRESLEEHVGWGSSSDA